MKRFSKRAKRIFVVSLAVAALAAFGAYAYFTSTGSGTGSAQVGTSADDLVLHGTVSGLMYPGGPGRTVSFTVDNPSNFNQAVSSINLDSVEAFSDSGWTSPIAGCLSGWFSMATVAVNPATSGNIAPNAVGQALVETGTLLMANAAVNQNACKNAYLKLNLSSS